MASSRNRVALGCWRMSTKTLSVNDAYNSTDAIDLNSAASVETWDLDVQMKADNQGTPASGDVVDVYVSFSHDNSTWDTDKSAQFLFRLDTNVEDPTVMSAPVRPTARYVKFVTKSGSAVATRNIVISGSIMDHRPQ